MDRRDVVIELSSLSAAATLACLASMAPPHPFCNCERILEERLAPMILSSRRNPPITLQVPGGQTDYPPVQSPAVYFSMRERSMKPPGLALLAGLLSIGLAVSASAQKSNQESKQEAKQDVAAAPVAQRAAPAAGAPRVLTGKERLGPKWTDEQRIDNCKVPVEKRGTKPRPSACTQAATDF
jgi:hypothetical protein